MGSGAAIKLERPLNFITSKPNQLGERHTAHASTASDVEQPGLSEKSCCLSRQPKRCSRTPQLLQGNWNKECQSTWMAMGDPSLSTNQRNQEPCPLPKPLGTTRQWCQLSVLGMVILLRPTKAVP